jgi:hypothetical protein
MPITASISAINAHAFLKLPRSSVFTGTILLQTRIGTFEDDVYHGVAPRSTLLRRVRGQIALPDRVPTLSAAAPIAAVAP